MVGPDDVYVEVVVWAELSNEFPTYRIRQVAGMASRPAAEALSQSIRRESGSLISQNFLAACLLQFEIRKQRHNKRPASTLDPTVADSSQTCDNVQLNSCRQGIRCRGGSCRPGPDIESLQGPRRPHQEDGGTAPGRWQEGSSRRRRVDHRRDAHLADSHHQKAHSRFSPYVLVFLVSTPLKANTACTT